MVLSCFKKYTDSIVATNTVNRSRLPERSNLEMFTCVRALLFPRASAFASFSQDPPEQFETIFRREKKKKKMDDEVGHLHKKVKQQATNTSVFGRGRQNSFSHGKTKKSDSECRLISWMKQLPAGCKRDG